MMSALSQKDQQGSFRLIEFWLKVDVLHNIVCTKAAFCCQTVCRPWTGHNIVDADVTLTQLYIMFVCIFS